MSSLKMKSSVILVLFFLLVANLNAKKVQGVIVDLKTNNPIPDVSVIVVSTDNVMKGVVLSDTSGYFGFEITELDSFYLKTYRTGYVNIEQGPFKIARLDSMNFLIRLEEQAYMLGEVVVEDVRIDQLLDRVGFIGRKDELNGTFFTRADIQEYNFSELSSLFRRAPGMRVVRDSQGNQRITSTRSGSLSKEAEVSALVYIDGILVNDDMAGFLDMVNINDIAAVEIYSSPIDAPMRYSRGQYAPVVLIWTGY